jgi:hypothetical protein
MAPAAPTTLIFAGETPTAPSTVKSAAWMAPAAPTEQTAASMDLMNASFIARTDDLTEPVEPMALTFVALMHPAAPTASIAARMAPAASMERTSAIEEWF